MTYQVVGVAHDIRGVKSDGSDSEQVYLPLPADRLQNYSILIRTQSDSTQVIAALATALSSIDPDIVEHASTLADILRLTPMFAIPGTAAMIATIVGFFGLLLADGHLRNC